VKNQEKEWYKKQVKDIDNMEEKLASTKTNGRLSIIMVFFATYLSG